MKKFILVVTFFVFMSGLFMIDKSYSKKTIVSYNGNSLRVSIDGVMTNSLPTNGTYYLANYDCNNSNTKVTWDKDTYQLSVTNGTKRSGVSCYLDFKSNPLLSEMPIGGYVKYTGNNGCVGNHCEGYNANYVNNVDMGYCGDSNFKFYTNGWRIAYKDNGRAYLISAGSPECMSTDSNGVISDDNSNGYLQNTADVHINNLNDIALKYCNSDYINGGVCDKNNVWAMGNDDFKKIINNQLIDDSCFQKKSDMKCGYNNNLIDNGGYYWFAAIRSFLTDSTYFWNSSYRGINADLSKWSYGVRPVLTLASSVIVVGGTGTYEDPYLIDNYTFNIDNNKSNIDENGNIISVELNMKSISDLVSKMCISVDTAVCTNYIDFDETYTLDLTGYGDGEKLIYVYYKNDNDKIIATMNRSITLS